MCDVIKSEFSLKKFGLAHGNRKAFYWSQWQWPSWLFLVFRLVVLGYAVAAFIPVIVPSSISQQTKHSLMVYLTIWTYMILMIHFLLATLLSFYYHFTQDKDGSDPAIVLCSGSVYHVKYGAKNSYNSIDEEKLSTGEGIIPSTNKNVKYDEETSHQPIHNGNGQSDTNREYLNDQSNVPTVVDPIDQSESRSETRISPMIIDDTEDNLTCLMKLSWFMSAIAQHFSIFVTLLYFSAVFPFLKNRLHLVNDLNLHAVNSLMVVLDLVVSARPVRLLHVIYPIIYGVVYVSFSIIYWSLDKEENILYAILDWNTPGITIGVISGAILILIPLIQLLLYGIYRLRMKIYRKINKIR